jgi:T-complex protein 1 subunit theta
MNKMVINHLDKHFITNDAATIVNELEVQYPTAKLLVLAARAQQEEIGDGANLTISFAGELLDKAEELTRMGLHPSEIIIGYTKAINKVYIYRPTSMHGIINPVTHMSLIFVLYKQTLEILEDLAEKGSENMDVRKKEEVVLRMKSVVASKQFGQEDVLCPLVADVG